MFSRPVCIKHDWGTKYLKQSGQRRKGKGRLKGIGIYLDNLANGWRSLQSLTTPDLDFSITCDMCKRRWVLNSMFPLSNKTNVGDWKMVFKRCTKFLTHLRSFCSAFSAREIFCLSRSCLSPYRVFTCRAFSLYCEHNCAVDLRPSGNFRISILSSSDQTLIFFPTRNWTNVKSFKLKTEFQQIHKNNKTTSLLYFPRFRLN